MSSDKEKKYIYIAFFAIILILIIVLITIWQPLFTSDSSFEQQLVSYESVTSEEYESEIVEKYKTLAKSYIQKGNTSNILNYIDQDYLEDNGITSEELESFLISNDILINYNSSTVLYNSSIKTNGEKYIYTFNYSDGYSAEKKIHFIENYYGNYTVSFDQDSYPLLNDTAYTVIQDEVTYIIEVIKSYEQNISVQVNITNNSTEQVTFDISSVNSVMIEMGGNGTYKLSTAIVGQDASTVDLLPGSTRQLTLSFEVSLADQDDLTGITFYNVKFTNGDYKDISLEIN